MEQKEFPFMQLALRKFKITSAMFGAVTRISNGALEIDKQEMTAALNRDGLFSEVDVKIVSPGETARIIHVMDAIQPRVKLSGGTTPFPGALGPMETAGIGETNVLEGVAVIQTGQRPGIQEGIIDMSGPGALYSQFSRTINIVLECTAFPEMTDLEFDLAARKAGLEAAVYLAEPTRNLAPDDIELYGPDARTSEGKDLPGVVYICHLQSQGLFRDTFVYGENARSLLPTVLHPNEVLDGAIVSSNYIIACQKNPSYFHVNNPVVLELARRNGQDLRFLGVIIANEHNTLREKDRSAKFAAKLGKQLGASGAVITQEGGGHSDTDLMLTCKECEKVGIRTVIIANEIAGPKGDLPSLVDSIPEADAVVTTGNNDVQVALPAMTRTVGGNSIAGISGPPESAFTTALGRLYTATNQLGAYRLTVKGY
ncbi:glycine/sarcosine/betaine reductase component B subunit [Desulfomonile tiedjei]|uniref:Glycine/sarcosine/betaine reductase component B alpha/beta subunit n=1 Tax=Desulfomonile tiedjei (strain ATCC 49306 / DSM 6799 / DCB-1) TaxID=706587 RepID=I4CBS7_DESTA|nr:glycine/sarcosine/betaine reductase component B subunit [Desulfomonile tiedjei]AFM27018.1 glycine/sarcosine/betaine reductase component B alpha/beta subunit [Desulfomonile tiedjei DSM 6799]